MRRVRLILGIWNVLPWCTLLFIFITSFFFNQMALPPNAAAHRRMVQYTRIRKEVADLKKNPRAYIHEFTKIHRCKDVFQFRISGIGGIYKDCTLTVSIDVSLEYPFKVPILKFMHPLFHPNVDAISGEVCSALLMQENWKPETTMEDVLINMISLMNEPDLSRPVNIEAAENYMNNKSAYLERCAGISKFLKK